MQKKVKSKSEVKLEHRLQRLEEEHQKLSVELRQTNDEQKQVNEIVSALCSSLEIKTLLQHTLHAVIDALGWEGGAVYLVDGKENSLVMKHHRHFPESFLNILHEKSYSLFCQCQKEC